MKNYLKILKEISEKDHANFVEDNEISEGKIKKAIKVGGAIAGVVSMFAGDDKDKTDEDEDVEEEDLVDDPEDSKNLDERRELRNTFRKWRKLSRKI